MAHAVRFYETGGPEVMRWESVDVGEPAEGQVRVRHEAVGLNFADTYFRTGLYPAQLPAGMGVEGAGIVEEVGPGVGGLRVGDRLLQPGTHGRSVSLVQHGVGGRPRKRASPCAAYPGRR